MTRIRAVLIAVIVGLGVGATGLVAQPTGCDFCGNHFWYNEHIHGNELDNLYDNVQGHGGEWFPYNCGIDHRLCSDDDGGAVNMALADASASLTVAAERPGWTTVRLARLLEALQENGIHAKASEAGLELSASCSEKGLESARTRVVALSEAAQERVRKAMNPVIQGP